MAVHHLKDGEDFGTSHFSKDFGFHGSAEAPRGRYAKGGSASPPFAADVDTHGPKSVAEPEEVGGGDYAEGGSAHPPFAADHDTHGPKHEVEPVDNGHDYARGGHITHMEHMPDGSAICHHAHGGRTIVHANGTSRHIPGHGKPMAEDTDRDGMARGGRARFPRAMIPVAGRRHSEIGGGPLTQGSALNRAPRNPTQVPGPRNAMPGGQMGYGVEPSAEPDQAGAGQGIPQMKHGGNVRMGADRGSFE